MGVRVNWGALWASGRPPLVMVQAPPDRPTKAQRDEVMAAVMAARSGPLQVLPEPRFTPYRPPLSSWLLWNVAAPAAVSAATTLALLWLLGA